MRTFKNFVLLAVVGAVVGAVVATVIAPGFISWYHTPGGTAQALCDCATLARDITGQLVRGQLIGAAIGAVLFVVIGVVIRVGRKKSPPASGIRKTELGGPGEVPPGTPPAHS